MYNYTRELQKQKVWRSIETLKKCPGNFGECCDSADVDCRKRIDNTGYPAIAEDEYMLIFGGMTWRNKSFVHDVSQTNLTLYDNCEVYVEQ